MEVKCIKCNTVTEAPGVTHEILHFGCPNCQKLISYEDNPDGKVLRELDTAAFTLAIGQKGVLFDKEYTVTASIEKNVEPYYKYREYTLGSEDGEWLYLSETDGHWIALRMTEDEYDVQNYPRFLTHNDISMNLYGYEYASVTAAEGFFDFEIPNYKIEMIEYIDPPYIFSIEKYRKEDVSYFGEHIDRDTIKKAFGPESVPAKTGVGIVQPFAINLRFMAIIFSAFAILILASHLFIYSGRQVETPLQETISFNEYNGKDFVSKPFTLKGASAPLTITVHSDVDNSWASVQVALINELTNDEEYATKDIEYYHGYEGGENWSEGNTTEEFNLCGVSEGRYHVVITPQKPPEDVNSTNVSVRVDWNKPSAWNMIIPIIAMILLMVGFYYLSLYFQQKRWANSDFSPYN